MGVCACVSVCVFLLLLSLKPFYPLHFVSSATQRKLFVCTRRSGYTYVYILYRMYVWGFEKDSLVKRVKEVWLSDGCYCQVLNKLRITRMVHEPRPLFKLRPRANCPQKYAMRMDEVSCRTVRMYEWVYESVSVCVCAVVSITVLVELSFLLLILHFLSAPPLPVFAVVLVLSFLPIGWASNTQT